MLLTAHQPLIAYFKNISLPSIPRISLPSLFSSSSSGPAKLAASGLDEAAIQRILSHIDAYIDRLLIEKFKSSQQDTIDSFLTNQQLILIIQNIVRETSGSNSQTTVIRENYVLTEADVEAIARRVLASLGELKTEWKAELRPDLDEITIKVLESEQLRAFIKGQVPDVNRLRVDYEASNAKLLAELEVLRLKCDALEIQVNSQSLDDLRARIEALESSDLDEKVRSIVLSLFGLSNSEDVVLWLKSVFVTRDYLEERLSRLYADRDAKTQESLNKLSAHLLEVVTTRFHEDFRQQTVTVTDDALIRRIVKEILARYDADKTALPDYALETAGGQVISTRCTVAYQRKTAQISVFGIPLWYQSSTPRVAITPSVHPGQCWAFAGFPGYLVVQLSRLIHVTGFTIEHIPKSLAPNGQIESAPKNFVVMVSFFLYAIVSFNPCGHLKKFKVNQHFLLFFLLR